MEARSLISPLQFTRCSAQGIPMMKHFFISRRSTLLPPTTNPSTQLINLTITTRNFTSCPKAGIKRNFEATGVPTSLPVRVAHDLHLAGHRYLDVRTPEEFSAGHVTGAINVPYMYKALSGMKKNPNFLQEVSSHFAKYDEIIVGCQMGKRSFMAATELLAGGFMAVTDIAGGYTAWTQIGLPTEQ